MATSKTLTPTNVTISIPEFTDQPDQRVNSNCLDKEADAINALNSNKMPGKVAELSDLFAFTDSAHNRLILRGDYPNADYLQAVFFGDTKVIQIMKSVGGTESTLATFVDDGNSITFANSENLTLSNCSAYNSIGVRVWKRGRIIIVAMHVQGLTANTRVQIATLPSGYRPLMDATFYGGGGLSYSNKTIITARATGELYVLPDDSYASGYFMFYAP